MSMPCHLGPHWPGPRPAGGASDEQFPDQFLAAALNTLPITHVFPWVNDPTNSDPDYGTRPSC